MKNLFILIGLMVINIGAGVQYNSTKKPEYLISQSLFICTTAIVYAFTNNKKPLR